MPNVGSTWKHIDGAERRIDAVGDGWVEPHDSGRWPLGDFDAQWTIVADVAALDTEPAPPPDRYDEGYNAGATAVRAQVSAALREGLIPLTSQRIAEIESRLLAISRGE